MSVDRDNLLVKYIKIKKDHDEKELRIKKRTYFTKILD